tara:strand:- start:30 stop:536 length:507 start_codon:yes stop_codon:yes gene_type:complete
MALGITANSNKIINFTLTETDNGKTISQADTKSLANAYTYGSGENQITNAVGVTGSVPSGAYTSLDFQSITQTTFSSGVSVNFTGIKHISIFNTSTGVGNDFVIRATGTAAFTNLFNGGSGNLIIKPYGYFSYDDPNIGTVVSTGNKILQIGDGGSGVSYKIYVLGLD